MPEEVKSPTRMSKVELKNLLLGLGYTEDQLLDTGGKSMKKPDLLEKLKAHQDSQDFGEP